MPESSARPRTLRQLREATGLTQTQVAQRMGVHKTRVSHIEAKYPAVRYDVLLRYVQAIGGYIRLSVAGMQINLSEIGSDPSLEGTRNYLTENASRAGVKRLGAEAAFSPVTYAPSAPAEELPLQGDQPESGGDDTGGQVDQPDAQSDQGDGGQRQEP